MNKETIGKIFIDGIKYSFHVSFWLVASIALLIMFVAFDKAFAIVMAIIIFGGWVLINKMTKFIIKRGQKNFAEKQKLAEIIQSKGE